MLIKNVDALIENVDALIENNEILKWIKSKEVDGLWAIKIYIKFKSVKLAFNSDKIWSLKANLILSIKLRYYPSKIYENIIIYVVIIKLTLFCIKWY